MASCRPELLALVMAIAMDMPLAMAANGPASQEQIVQHVHEREPDEQGADAPQLESEYALTFSRAGGAPGTDVALPLYFSRIPGADNVGQVRVRMHYPAAPLKLKEVELAYLSKRAELEVETVEEGADGDQTALTLTFRLPDLGKNYPSGQIAYLHFTIAHEAADETVTLQTELWIDEQHITETGPLAKLEQGQILISKDPIFVGCFFFTH